MGGVSPSGPPFPPKSVGQSFRRRFISVNKNQPFIRTRHVHRIFRDIIYLYVGFGIHRSERLKMFVFHYKSKYSVPLPSPTPPSSRKVFHFFLSKPLSRPASNVYRVRKKNIIRIRIKKKKTKRFNLNVSPDMNRKRR